MDSKQVDTQLQKAYEALLYDYDGLDLFIRHFQSFLHEIHELKKRRMLTGALFFDKLEEFAEHYSSNTKFLMVGMYFTKILPDEALRVDIGNGSYETYESIDSFIYTYLNFRAAKNKNSTMNDKGLQEFFDTMVNIFSDDDKLNLFSSKINKILNKYTINYNIKKFKRYIGDILDLMIFVEKIFDPSISQDQRNQVINNDFDYLREQLLNALKEEVIDNNLLTLDSKQELLEMVAGFFEKRNYLDTVNYLANLDVSLGLKEDLANYKNQVNQKNIVYSDNPVIRFLQRHVALIRKIFIYLQRKAEEHKIVNELQAEIKNLAHNDASIQARRFTI